jgi:hypothetical protein
MTARFSTERLSSIFMPVFRNRASTGDCLYEISKKLLKKEIYMSDSVYCTKCILKKTHPGIKFDSAGECSFCSGSSVGTDYVEKYTAIVGHYEKFMSSPQVSDGEYDCLLMLSGGKDSMYMLNKLKTETSKRIIAYTYDLPYESRNAIKNIKEISRLIDGDYISFSSYSKHKQLMRKVFLSEKKNTQFRAEKTPCAICSSYLIASACFMAMSLKIPYVLYCADPIQMLGVETDLKKLIQLLASHLGWDFLDELMGRKARRVMETDSKELPSVVFPYVSMMNSYDKESIIKELERLGKLLPSSMGTMCSLYPILEYYSYKNYDCCIDSLEYAVSARKGVSSRDTLIRLTGEYRKIIMEIAVKEQLSEQDKSIIRNFSKQVHPNSETDAEAMYQQIISLRSVAQELGIFDDLVANTAAYKKAEEEKFLNSVKGEIGEDF